MKKTGAQIVIACLLEQGVDTVFGFPGGAVLNIYDALYEARDQICHVLTAHEQGASHAADGYARATGKTGVVIATSGPGSTNLVTGIATAYMDSIPVVAITGNVATPLLGRDSFQEVDIAGITMPITKHNFVVRDVKELAGILRRAFKIAASGRPGPVLVDIPKDITAAEAEYEFLPVSQESALKPREADQTALAKAAEMVKAAKKPLVYTGGGVISSGATQQLVRFAERIDSPVCSSVMGLGGFPATNPHFIGMIGMHGTYASGRAASECDLVVAVGARFSDRVAGNRKLFAPKAQIIHIDVDAAEIDKNVPTHHHIVGDVGRVLAGLNELLPQLNHSVWNTQVAEWQNCDRIDGEAGPEKITSAVPSTVTPQYVIGTIRSLAMEDTIIVTDVGQHQMWTAQYYPFTLPRTFLTSGGLGTMGYGLGAAIGAQKAFPNRRVVLISGDGSFHMNCNELATAVNYGLPITIVVMNNSALGMVRQWQKMFYCNRFSCTSPNRKTDFVKLAEAYGAQGERILKAADVQPVLKKAMLGKGPVVVDCVISEDENVLPMIPPGSSVDQIVTSMS